AAGVLAVPPVRRRCLYQLPRRHRPRLACRDHVAAVEPAVRRSRSADRGAAPEPRGRLRGRVGRVARSGRMGLLDVPGAVGVAILYRLGRVRARDACGSRVSAGGSSLAGRLLPGRLRADAAAIALVASGKRWRYALAGFLMLLGVGLLFCGHALPQTMASKALVYGIHPGDWTWLAPREFDFLSIAVGIGCAVALLKQREGHRPPWLYVTGAVAFLLAHVAFGSPHFWWWAVPPFAMLSFVACESIRRPWHLVIALACLALFAGRQWHALTERTEREAQLWHAG